jgi:serine/threonine-protein kinase HipA
VCLDPLHQDADESGAYHRQCLEELFGVDRLPLVDVGLELLQSLGSAMVGYTTLCGSHPKICMSLVDDGATLRLALVDSRFILKFQTQVMTALPENEHLSMRLATLVGIETPPCGLVRLIDGTWGYVVRRFDRAPDGGKRRLEDFCQLTGKPRRGKHVGTAELCEGVLHRFSAEPQVDVLKLYRLLLFSWWIGNGDLHLKNLSMLCDAQGRHRLSPAYGLVNTDLQNPDDDLSLSVGGKHKGLNRQSWLDFADHSSLSEEAAVGVLDRQVAFFGKSCELIAASPMPDPLKDRYQALIERRTELLTEGV